ncbi:MAG TPA: CHASE3 domain-containing protein [Candidatus Acidoferrales bacterium]|nr:CHASE3 domain-containing protein [Candidatus Acidoferrales bacterium]
MKPSLPLRILIPLLLGIVALLAIAVYVELGVRRLLIATRQVAGALEMAAAILGALALIVDAETRNRGYVITGRDEYLRPYQAAVPKIGDALHRLGELVAVDGRSEQRDMIGQLNALCGKQLVELEEVVALGERDGSEAAQALINTGIGRTTTDEIRVTVDAMAVTHRKQIDEAKCPWSSDVAFVRVAIAITIALTIAVLLVVRLLARRDSEQRDERRRSMREDQFRLEALAQKRTADLSGLSSYLQVLREEEKSKLARDLRDELGAILMSAKMDVAWVEKRIKGRDTEAATKLERTLQALDDGVQVKRRIIEDLRPSLLDNPGLAAAIDWQVNEFCNRAGLECTVSVPGDDLAFDPRLSIALYRILQEALTNIAKYARAKNVQVELSASNGHITLLIKDDGIGVPDDAQNNKLAHGNTGMRQRARMLGGEYSSGRRPEGGTGIEINIALEHGPDVEHRTPARVDAPV